MKQVLVSLTIKNKHWTSKVCNSIVLKNDTLELDAIDGKHYSFPTNIFKWYDIVNLDDKQYLIYIQPTNWVTGGLEFVYPNSIRNNDIDFTVYDNGHSVNTPVKYNELIAMNYKKKYDTLPGFRPKTGLIILNKELAKKYTGKRTVKMQDIIIPRNLISKTNINNWTFEVKPRLLTKEQLKSISNSHYVYIPKKDGTNAKLEYRGDRGTYLQFSSTKYQLSLRISKSTK